MKKSIVALSALMTLTGAGFAASGAHAQNTTTTTIEQIEVWAPHSRPRAGGFTNAPIENVYVSRRVDVRDIDLRSPGGQVELDKRIAAAARSACDRLDKMYPLGEPSKSTCEKETIADTRDQVAALVAQGHR